MLTRSCPSFLCSITSILGLIAEISLLSGCVNLTPAGTHSVDTEITDHCRSPAKAHSVAAIPTSGLPLLSSLIQGNTSDQLHNYFSEQALRTAETVGVLPYLQHLIAIRDFQGRSLFRVLLLRQELYAHTMLAILEIESATAEIVCERDRADQVADRIDEVDGSRVKQLTIASIVIGGVANIVTGAASLAFTSSTAADASSIAGGALSTWLGVSALVTHSKVYFRHDPNILHEVWEDPRQPQIVSPILWRYLHRSGEPMASAPRTNLVNSWRQLGRLGAPDSDIEGHRRSLFFGSGGEYMASELRARASMLQTLETTLRLLHEELEALIREANAFAVRQNELMESG